MDVFASDFEDRRRSAKYVYDQELTRIMMDEHRVNKTLAEYARTGVFYASEEFKATNLGLTPREVAAKVAGAAGQHLIYAEECPSYEPTNFVMLEIPNNTRMANIASTLTLIATPIEERTAPPRRNRRYYRTSGDRDGVYGIYNARCLRFEFHGKKACRMFYDWCNLLASTPVYKHLLKDLTRGG